MWPLALPIDTAVNPADAVREIAVLLGKIPI
jgi:hypothetical protein